MTVTLKIRQSQSDLFSQCLLLFRKCFWSVSKVKLQNVEKHLGKITQTKKIAGKLFIIVPTTPLSSKTSVKAEEWKIETPRDERSDVWSKNSKTRSPLHRSKEITVTKKRSVSTLCCTALSDIEYFLTTERWERKARNRKLVGKELLVIQTFRRNMRKHWKITLITYIFFQSMVRQSTSALQSNSRMSKCIQYHYFWFYRLHNYYHFLERLNFGAIETVSTKHHKNGCCTTTLLKDSKLYTSAVWVL